MAWGKVQAPGLVCGKEVGGTLKEEGGLAPARLQGAGTTHSLAGLKRARPSRGPCFL